MKVWINAKRIDGFRTCGLKYYDTYIAPKTEKPKWSEDPAVSAISANIKRAFEASSTLFRGKLPGILDRVREEELKFEKEKLLFFEKSLHGFLAQHKFSAYEAPQKPFFLDAVNDYGYFSKPECVVKIDGRKTFVFINFWGNSKIKETLSTDAEHLINVHVLKSKFKDPVSILYLFPNNGHILFSEIDDEAALNAASFLSEFLNDLGKGDFSARRNPLCDWCDSRPDCPGWKGIASLPPQRSRDLFRLSYSKLDLFKRCPFAYKKLYIDKVPQRPRDFFSIGSTIHLAMEEIFKLPALPEKSAVTNIFHHCWVSLGFSDKADEKKQKEDALSYFLKYIDTVVAPDFAKAFETEYYFQQPVQDSVIVNGFIDRVDKKGDTYEIVDYKTEDSLRTQEELDNDLQLTLYFWAARRIGWNISRLALHFVRFSKVMYTTREPGSLDAFEHEMIEWFGKIKKETEFAPKENKYCANCDHNKNGCPLFK